MLGLRDLPAGPAQPNPPAEAPIAPVAEDALLQSPHALSDAAGGAPVDTGDMNFHVMDTPLVMSGFSPQAIALWQQKMAGTSLAAVAAGGMMSGSSDGASALDDRISTSALATLKPGSAISAQLVRGDVEIAATCTITYIDPKQLLACGHPILQAGPVSLPMTTAEVVTTLASPLNAFKIINTGATVGAFTEDRESGIRGILGAQAHMIPMHIAIEGPDGPRKVNVEVLDLPSLTCPGGAGGSLRFPAAIERKHGRNQLPHHRQHRRFQLPARSARSVGIGRRHDARSAGGSFAGRRTLHQPLLQ